MQDVKNSIIQKLSEYSKNQRKLANFLLENLETIPLLSVSDLAKQSGVSSATVVRFSRVLGFQGYLEFRGHLLELLKEKLSPVAKFKATISKKEGYTIVKCKFLVVFKHFNVEEPSILSVSVAKDVEVKSVLYLK